MFIIVEMMLVVFVLKICNVIMYNDRGFNEEFVFCLFEF